MPQNNWKNKFTAIIRKRGKHYLDQGKVSILCLTDEVCTAVVSGTGGRNYQVRIDHPFQDDMAMECRCPYARSGYCKHMAAVLYAAEAELKKKGRSADMAAREADVATEEPGQPQVSGVEAEAPIQPLDKRAASEATSQARSAEIVAQAAGDAETKHPAQPASSAGKPVQKMQPAKPVKAANNGVLEKLGDRARGTQVFSALTPEAGTYHYFDLAAMARDLKLSDKCWAEAVQLVSAGKVTLAKLEVGFLQDNSLEYLISDIPDDEMLVLAKGIVRDDTFRSSQQNGIVVLFSRKRVLYMECRATGCWNDYHLYGERPIGTFCEHGAALFLCAADRVLRENLGDATNAAGMKFLRAFAGQSGAQPEALAAQLPIDMEARLQNESGRLYASFRVGSGRLYLIQDLEAFGKAVASGGVMQFGKNTLLQLNRELFTERAQRYWNFIRTALEDNERMGAFYRSSYGYGGFSEEMKKSIPLYAARLDAFYEMVGTDRFECQNKKAWNRYYPSSATSGAKELLFAREKSFQPKLTLSKQVDKDGMVQAAVLEGELPPIFYGRNYAYYIADGALNRMDVGAVQALKPLLAMAEDGQIRLNIGRRHLAEFFYDVLPVLSEQADIEEQDTEALRAVLPPMVQLVFFLDAEDGVVSCRAEAHYGNEVRYLSDLARRTQGDGDRLEDFRDLGREGRAMDVLETFAGEESLDEKTGTFYIADEDRVFDFCTRGVEALTCCGEVRTTQRFRDLGKPRKPKITVGVQLESGLMNLDVEADGMEPEELAALLESYRKKRKFYRLRDGSFMRADGEELAALEQMLETLRITPAQFVKGKMQIPAYRALYLDRMLEETESLYADRDRRFKRLIKEFKTVQDSDFELPGQLKTVLRRYQVTGYRWLRTLRQYGFGGILADDMGLGKTLQVIAVLSALRAEGEEGASLIVSPASLVYNWLEEFQRFAPELSVCAVAGTQKERSELIARAGEWDVLVTSYDLLKRDIDQYEPLRFSCEVLDEAQYIKNHTTAAAKAVKLIRSQTRFALTGTPIENRLSELWSIFDYLMPGFLYGYETFRKELETPIAKNGDKEASARLQRMAAPFVLRRLKGDVLKDLPEKLEEVRVARMEGEQRKLYDAEVLRLKQMLAAQDDETFGKNKLQILAELTRIRQLCCDPSLCLENYKGASAKREMALELMQNAAEGGHKMLLFSQFTSMLELLERDLEQAGLAYYKITGDTPKEERVRLVKRFNEDSTPVFLISLKAGGTGLNLTGADLVIHYDPWWNLAVQNQATDRAHRIGQTRKVTVYKLIAKNSIEERIVEMQEAKRALADEILSGEGLDGGRLSREELMALFS